MRLLSLFEEDEDEDEVNSINNPEAKEILEKAVSKYGWKKEPLSALVNLVQEQETQSNTTSNVNNTDLIDRMQATFKKLTDQIAMELDSDTVAELKIYLDKLKQLAEKKGVVFEDDIEWEPQPEFRGIGGTSTSFGDSAKRQRAMKGMPSSNNRYQKQDTNKIDSKLQVLWTKYINRLKQTPKNQRAQFKDPLKRIMIAAKEQGITLEPSLT